jgi:hypothetical protein
VCRWLFFALTILLTPELHGQDGAVAPAGRVDQIEEQRSEKAAKISGGNPEEAEGTISRIGHIVSRAPVTFEVGGLGPGAGPAINSVLRKNAYDGHLPARVWGHLEIHGFYSVGTGAELRTISKHDLTFALDGSYADSPQLEYYGPGQNSSIHNQTNFRREDTLFNFRVGLRTHHELAEACRVGGLLQHVGPGTNDNLPTTQSVFGPAQAPGIDGQSSYLIAGCSVQLDLRDFSEDPHKGTYVWVGFDRYNAESLSRFSFYRVPLVAEQYIPFFNRKRVIALRARTDLSFHSEDEVVPFYLQPTLGSDMDLRGYRRYRFYDENSLSLNAEYRWEIGLGFDMALFIDGGNVYHRPWQVSFSDLKSSAGFGLRIKNENERRVLARLDVGFSREGFQIWLRVPELF